MENYFPQTKDREKQDLTNVYTIAGSCASTFGLHIHLQVALTSYFHVTYKGKVVGEPVFFKT